MKAFKVVFNLDDEMVRHYNMNIFICARTAERAKEIVKERYPEFEGYIINISGVYEIKNEGVIYPGGFDLC